MELFKRDKGAFIVYFIITPIMVTLSAIRIYLIFESVFMIFLIFGISIFCTWLIATIINLVPHKILYKYDPLIFLEKFIKKINRK